ncbi:MAG TPA: response regulator [Roseiflexaceae bacterium]|nr:response regulator [Roseiflexaceae bacterium]
MQRTLISEPTLSDQSDSYNTEPALPQWRILIADDDPYIRQLLEAALSDAGYDVTSAIDGYELVRLAQDRPPSLILVDLAMPRMDGYEAIRQLRNDTRTAHVPMLILTARTSAKDVVTGFETGADDYIAKPFDINELLARVKSHLRRSAQRPVLNPLTGLPGGVLLSQAIHQRLACQTPFALLYADLDNFKAFNDIYGFSRGDQALLFVASIIQKVMAEHGNPDDTIGHIGGDDFAMLTTPDRAEPICHALIRTFDAEVPQLYSVEDRQRGYISGADRYGILRRFDLMTISIGVVTTQRRGFSDQESLTRVAAEMKHHAKEQAGSTFAVDQRSSLQGSEVERRRAHNRTLLLLSNDSSLRAVLRSTFRDGGYNVLEVETLDGACRTIAALQHPAVVLADAQLGQTLWDVCDGHTSNDCNLPIVVLAHDIHDIERAQAAKITAYLQLPLPLIDIVACVEQLIIGGNAAREEKIRGGS